ncbi:hypothetical protein [Nocardioides humi]|uniref:hypothetical protein n=1 Tax=Nocardioides humi TaxID=449461 RepID=UPI0015E832B7|nr:hypothetical protein [Nocardioides humi]
MPMNSSMIVTDPLPPRSGPRSGAHALADRVEARGTRRTSRIATAANRISGR